MYIKLEKDGSIHRFMPSNDEKPGSDELDSIKREIRKFKKERGIK